MKRSKREEKKMARAIKQDLQFCFLAISFIAIITLGSIIEKML